MNQTSVSMASGDTRKAFFARAGSGDLPLVLLGDDRFAMGLAATLRSLRRTLGSDSNLEVLLCSLGLTEVHRERLGLAGGLGDGGQSMTILQLPEQPGFQRLERVMDKLNIRHRVARCWFAKIAALEAAASAGMPWCLFLDGDVLVNRDFSELLAPSAFPLKAVEDKGTVDWSRGVGVPDFKAAGLDAGAPFFNSGVMLLDLDWWRQAGVFQQCLDWAPRLQVWFAENQPGWQFSDQNVLNVVYHQRWEQLPGCWNRQGTLGEGLLQGLTQGEPAVFHFCTHPKPWDRPVDRHSIPFFNVLDETPYRGLRPAWWQGPKFLMSKVKCRVSQWVEGRSSRIQRLDH